ncbi:MAG: YraN family protein [Geminicoccaceae bacterium]
MSRDWVRAERRGRLAEWLAAWFLRAKGYRILARRAKTPVGEIDLVARHRDVIIFVEVKARRQLDGAREALTSGQRRRIVRAASWYLQRQDRYRGLAIRFDLIAIAPLARPHHLQAAWRADDP